jgi:stage V sporulation protein G
VTPPGRSGRALRIPYSLQPTAAARDVILWRALWVLRRRPGCGDDTEHASPSGTVSITVLSVKPVKFGRIFALASVEVDIDGVLLVIHGVRAIRVQPIGTRIDLPMFRDEDGTWRHAITLPDEISEPIGRAVLNELVERGLAVRGPAP